MTPQPPNPQAQIDFLADVQTLLNEGQFTATYKFALLIALADLAIDLGDDSGSELEVPVAKIAEKFVEYYWRQASPWVPIGRSEAARILAQNSGQQAEVLNRLRDVRDRANGYQVLARRDSKAWRSLMSSVKSTVKRMPLWKLQKLQGRTLDFLYQNTGRGDSIILKPGVTWNLRRFHPLVIGLARSAWLQFVRQLPKNRMLLGEAQDLSAFLFGAERADLKDYRTTLRDLQEGRCFYCRKPLTTPGDVDHFVPWARYPVDLAHNFVLAHERCNGQKSDFLADVPHLERWVERNSTFAADLEKRFSGLDVLFDRQTSLQVTAWAYAQVERNGGRVWAGGADFRDLAPEWRHVLSVA